MSSAAFGQHEPNTLRWAGDVLEHLCGLREAPSIPEPQRLAPDGILGLSSNALDQKPRAAREQATTLSSEERALVRYKIDGYLASSSYVSRARGCRMVGNGGFTERLEVLISFAGDRRESGAYQELPIVRRDAFRGLQHLGVASPQVLGVLERGLSDPYFEARSKAAQAIGGAAGNPVAIHNIVAASATVGLLGREGDLIRKTVLITAYYSLVGGAVSFLWIYGVGFNAGLIQLVLLVALLAGLVVWMVDRDKKIPQVQTPR